MKFDLEFLKRLLCSTETECVSAVLSAYPENIHHPGSYIFIEGNPDTQVVLVAHMDTVGSPNPGELVQDRRVLRTTGASPLGADDRAGVFAAMRIHASVKRKPHLLFTQGEERGGQGAKEFIKNADLCAKLSKLRLMIELDRQSGSDYVTYDDKLDNELMWFIEGFGYNKAFGSYSDISTIGPKVKVPSVNLAIGYYSQHTGRERLHLDELFMTINRVTDMLGGEIPLTTYHERAVYTGKYHDGYYDFSKKKSYGKGKYKREVSGLAFYNRHFEERDKRGVIGYNPTCNMVEGLLMGDGKCDLCHKFWLDCDCGGMAEAILVWLDPKDLVNLMKEVPAELPIMKTLTQPEGEAEVLLFGRA